MTLRTSLKMSVEIVATAHCMEVVTKALRMPQPSDGAAAKALL